MAIDPVVFAREMTLLAERFNRNDLSAPLRERYFAFLTDRLSNEEFAAAAQTVFNHDTFWPAPVRFLEAIGMDPQSEAEAAWELALDEASRGVGKMLTEYSPAHAAALREVGMNRAIGLTPEARLPFVKRKFVAAYRAAAERAAGPALEEA